MAPVYSARRLIRSLYIVIFVLFMHLCYYGSGGLIVYDRQALLDIKTSVDLQFGYGLGPRGRGFQFLSDIPTELLSYPHLIPERRFRRRRGKRGGLAVKIKAYLAFLRRRGGSPRLAWCPRFLSVGRRWTRPVVPGMCNSRMDAVECFYHRRLRNRERNVDYGNLMRLKYAKSSTCASAPSTIRLALLNARSLANKTFVLISRPVYFSGFGFFIHHRNLATRRERTKLVYSMYSRMSGETVQRNLMKLGVNFFILEDSWCTRRTRPGCSMPEIWDVEDPDNVGKTPFCTQMSNNPWPYFTTVFSNDVYKVLGVPKDLR